MMNVNDLEIKQREVKERLLEEDANYFEKLSQGQNPSYYVLACCDSRTCPSTVTGQPLGQLFIHRNIANQALPEDASVTSSLYYALHVLEVDYVLVLGHTFCGGVQAVRKGDLPDELETWVQHVRTATGWSPEADVPEDGTTLEKQNIRSQVEAIQEHPVYQAGGRKVPVLGAMYHIENGDLEWVVRPDAVDG
ncbi:carbonic anhydrase [Alkalicoccus chagannorensis]|uniref:carbonic anhydrase n=1 Tax=Alkalicoccus chagannorensis TaxID=427072 RepID=UPI0003FAFF8B|nr:carbonic anhydrase [Alkalicoccus chagannorensis]